MHRKVITFTQEVTRGLVIYSNGSQEKCWAPLVEWMNITDYEE